MRKQTAVLVGLGLLVAAGAGYWTGRAQRGSEPKHRPEPAPLVAHAALEAPAQGFDRAEPVPTVRPGTDSATPLPSLDTPLRLSLAELVRRADAGEPKAACRLAAEWSYCNSIRRRLDSADYALELRVRQPEMERASLESLKASTESLLAQAGRCEGVDEPPALRFASRWRQAALAGNPAAMRGYATGNAFHGVPMLDMLPVLVAYRGEAEAVARRAADGGDMGVALALAAAYSPLPTAVSLLKQSVRRDGVQALALYLRVRNAISAADLTAEAHRQLQANIEQIGARLTTEQRDLARRMADEAPRLQMPPQGLPPGLLQLGMFVGTPERGDCDGTTPPPARPAYPSGA